MPTHTIIERGRIASADDAFRVTDSAGFVRAALNVTAALAVLVVSAVGLWAVAALAAVA